MPVNRKHLRSGQRKQITLFVCAMLLAFASNIVCASALVEAPTPLLFGENKNERGEQLPIPQLIKQLLMQVESDTGMHFSIKNYPWPRAISMARNEGKLIFGLSLTSEREKLFSFSEPLYYNNVWIVTRSDQTFPFKSLEDLKGKTIGILRGASYGDDFDRAQNKLFKVEEDIGVYSVRLKKLNNKRMDAILFASPDSRAAQVQMRINQILRVEAELNAQEIPSFSVLPTPLLKDGLRFAIRRDQNSELLQRIDKAITKGKTTGSFNKILQTYTVD